MLVIFCFPTLVRRTLALSSAAFGSSWDFCESGGNMMWVTSLTWQYVEAIRWPTSIMTEKNISKNFKLLLQNFSLVSQNLKLFSQFQGIRQTNKQKNWKKKKKGKSVKKKKKLGKMAVPIWNIFSLRWRNMIYRFSFVKLVMHNSVNRILCWIIALQSIKIIK